jgi:pimeloyl-ACP methyl ester carboxylesterase
MPDIHYTVTNTTHLFSSEPDHSSIICQLTGDRRSRSSQHTVTRKHHLKRNSIIIIQINAKLHITSLNLSHSVCVHTRFIRTDPIVRRSMTEKPIVIFIHGKDSASTTWKKLFAVEDLKEKFHLFAIDLPGEQ